MEVIGANDHFFSPTNCPKHATSNGRVHGDVAATTLRGWNSSVRRETRMP